MEANSAPELLCFPHSLEYLPLCLAEQIHSYRFTWNYLRVSKWWQNFHFWVNSPFKAGEIFPQWSAQVNVTPLNEISPRGQAMSLPGTQDPFFCSVCVLCSQSRTRAASTPEFLTECSRGGWHHREHESPCKKRSLFPLNNILLYLRTL